MLLEGLAEGFAEDAHAAAVDYSYSGQSGEECVVDKLFYCPRCIVYVVTDHVDFRRRVLTFVLVIQRHRDSPGSRGFYWRVRCPRVRECFGTIGARDLH